MKDIRIDITKNEVVMTKAFADKASDPRSKEYRILQDVIKTYPNITVRRHHIKQNPKRNCYEGLTYEYMRNYISTHGSEEVIKETLAEFDELLLLAECHSKTHRYPTIKAWFLRQYPNVEIYGTQEFVEATSTPKVIEDKSFEELIKVAA